jgi:hypothetical protein
MRVFSHKPRRARGSAGLDADGEKIAKNRKKSHPLLASRETHPTTRIILTVAESMVEI